MIAGWENSHLICPGQLLSLGLIMLFQVQRALFSNYLRSLIIPCIHSFGYFLSFDKSLSFSVLGNSPLLPSPHL